MQYVYEEKLLNDRAQVSSTCRPLIIHASSSSFYPVIMQQSYGVKPPILNTSLLGKYPRTDGHVSAYQS